MPKFNVGDVVTMAEHGKRHMSSFNRDVCMAGGGNNPWGISGTIYKYDSDEWDTLPINVEWNNGLFNCYAEDDLEFFNLNLENK